MARVVDMARLIVAVMAIAVTIFLIINPPRCQGRDFRVGNILLAGCGKHSQGDQP